jgi:hypothetical protein
VRAEPTDVLRSFFAELDRPGVEQALLHDPDDPFAGPGSDIDLVVGWADEARLS